MRHQGFVGFVPAWNRKLVEFTLVGERILRPGFQDDVKALAKKCEAFFVVSPVRRSG
jgi:hypothetical protein